ncbi:peptidyl-prolyl cis-trans isomerase FKBP16-4, chloroplastic isoform X2 [Diospyros lotus]|uniref:peptidyl-prolyl cis-trans isomerase FKBP16-4, chloroplastic isoform X2 n=1 Tax=Diospyros lotus TaxID=55363 RepID=UPI0022524970|nr:peptidyl-prolyl cis-trans isomerase FKBP16-4, chloroplastic isoform X2 [Diospyros lotus]
MELSLLHQKPTFIHHSLTSIFSTGKRPFNRNTSILSCHCSSSSSDATAKVPSLSSQCEGRRALMGCLLAAAAGISVCDVAGAASTSRRALRGEKIPESDFKTLPNGLKYYDLKVGNGTEAVKGSRVAVHYVAKWKGITFMTSRQGLGVGGGTRLLIVPPELAYGSKGVQEIPPNATIELDVELLAIKQSPFGSPVKIVEG